MIGKSTECNKSKRKCYMVESVIFVFSLYLYREVVHVQLDFG
ncbi:hypothetical protein HMPREF9442_02705 [Paraprevotella xylaniphila YIT 11841]|uniref:Uncharacterized protein n=1 Tax=Paraprevotella xylaniphila YIT 11841 TaxID=762982 RepID=F3QWX3_9BACT|nr:hypothetical protein HMPREF9442_02705 [Paraprevotella xylaniphila YIT 11841]